MAITPEQVKYIADLAQLDPDDEKRDMFADQLDAVLQYVEKLNELDTGGVEPLVFMAERCNVFRSDTAGASLPRSQALRNAPDQAEGCFKVPRIIE